MSIRFFETLKKKNLQKKQIFLKNFNFFDLLLCLKKRAKIMKIKLIYYLLFFKTGK